MRIGRIASGWKAARHVVVALAVVGVLVTVAADCTQGSEDGDRDTTKDMTGVAAPSASSRHSAGATPAQTDEAGAVVRAFLDLEPISPPFISVESYFYFLKRRMQLLNFQIYALPVPGGGWEVVAELQSQTGERLRAACTFDPAHPWPEGPAQFWRRCPEMGGLWTAFAPTSFTSFEAARPYLPPATISLPEPEPPGGYRLALITIPEAGAEASAELFAFRMVYEREGSDPVEVIQKFGQTGLPVGEAWSNCQFGRWPAGGSCRAFHAKLTSVVVSTSAANAEIVWAFAHAIDPRQQP